MRGLVRFVNGLVLGAIVGGTMALLFAPRKGADTQKLIQDRMQSILAEGQEAAETRRLELTEKFEELKRPSA